MSESELDIADQLRWTLVQQRDKSAESQFVYAVRTTGVYCRPGCASRLPRRANVAFFDNVLQARAAGFRPCRRCRPDDCASPSSQVDAVRSACRLIDEAEEPPSLQQLAAAASYSPSHFHRLFKKLVGVTPRAYAAMRRANRVRKNLLHDQSVIQAVHSSGYGAGSRFYEESAEVLGMQPSEYRNGAQGVEILAAVAMTSLGPMLVAATDKGLCAIEFGDDEQELRQQLCERFPHAEFHDSDEFQSWIAGIIACVDTPGEQPSLPLDVQGTAFQRRVWEALRRVPPGSTTTYSDVAASIGQPKSARAVARACAANPLAVAIPCHRVVRNDGGLGGYRWGIERKEALLQQESGISSARAASEGAT